MPPSHFLYLALVELILSPLLNAIEITGFSIYDHPEPTLFSSQLTTLDIFIVEFDA